MHSLPHSPLYLIKIKTHTLIQLNILMESIEWKSNWNEMGLPIMREFNLFFFLLNKIVCCVCEWVLNILKYRFCLFCVFLYSMPTNHMHGMYFRIQNANASGSSIVYPSIALEITFNVIISPICLSACRTVLHAPQNSWTFNWIRIVLLFDWWWIDIIGFSVTGRGWVEPPANTDTISPLCVGSLVPNLWQNWYARCFCWLDRWWHRPLSPAIEMILSPLCKWKERQVHCVSRWSLNEMKKQNEQQKWAMLVKTYLKWSKARRQWPGETRNTSTVLVSMSFNVGECTNIGVDERLYTHIPSASLLKVTPANMENTINTVNSMQTKMMRLWVINKLQIWTGKKSRKHKMHSTM